MSKHTDIPPSRPLPAFSSDAMDQLALGLRLMEEEAPPYEPANVACCSICSGKFRLQDCSSYLDYESWEMPATYIVHDCPLCEGGCIEDYDTLPPWGLLWSWLSLQWRSILWAARDKAFPYWREERGMR